MVGKRNRGRKRLKKKRKKRKENGGGRLLDLELLKLKERAKKESLKPRVLLGNRGDKRQRQRDFRGRRYKISCLAGRVSERASPQDNPHLQQNC